LGFSYNPFNVARLSIGGSLDLSTKIIGTTHGLFGIEIEDAKDRLGDALGGDLHLLQQVHFEDNLDILREHMFLG